MDGPEADNKRRWPRVEVLLKVEYSEPRDLLADYLTNLGDGGMFVRTEIAFASGQRIRFALSFPGLLEPIELGGVVRWRRRFDPERPTLTQGVGVEFEFPSDETRERLKRTVAELQREAGAEELPEGRRLRVLIVEDNEFVQDLLAYGVRRFHWDHASKKGLELLCASSAPEALEKLEETEVDLAIIDHFMPIMTGCELVRRMRQAEPSRATGILVVSVGGEAVKREALDSGADLFLDKPVLNRQLMKTLTTLLARRDA